MNEKKLIHSLCSTCFKWMDICIMADKVDELQMNYDCKAVVVECAKYEYRRNSGKENP